jgi:hypothetical protein
MVNNYEEVFDFELLTYVPERRWREAPRSSSAYRLTEREAYEKNQAFGLNSVPKRFVRVEPRKINAC